MKFPLSKKFAVVASTQGSILRRVFSATNREEFNIDLIVTDRTCGALEFGTTNSIESILIEEHSNIKFSNKLLEVLEEKNITNVYLFYTRKIEGKILSRYDEKIINFHPSLLPSFAGLNSLDRSISSGVLLVGSTAHYVAEEIDCGKQLIQTFTTTLSPDLKAVRHIIFAQQCATLHYLHQMINTEELANIRINCSVDLSQGFIPNISSQSFRLYERIVTGY